MACGVSRPSLLHGHGGTGADVGRCQILESLCHSRPLKSTTTECGSGGVVCFLLFTSVWLLFLRQPSTCAHLTFTIQVLQSVSAVSITQRSHFNAIHLKRELHCGSAASLSRRRNSVDTTCTRESQAESTVRLEEMVINT